jgi:Do/DeqQ family serine protease
VAPAVVTIHSARRVRAPQQFPFFSDPSFREFFGDRTAPAPPRGGGREVRGLGSGVIVAADGLCLTNHHVIDGAEAITVELTDRRTFEAQVVGSDPPSDLAVIKINARELPRLTLGDSERVRVGDVALAIGNPLGVGQTVTLGIISAKGRYTGLSDGAFEDFLQTDAPINQGNSGGALVNAGGELIGINSQILSTSGGNIGIGFAIPSSMARNVMQQLVENGRVRRAQLGVVVEPVTPEAVKRANRADARGVVVREVVPGSPAAKAGLRAGDIITAMNGTPIDDSNSLRIHVASSQPGTQATLTVWRDGREEQVRVTLAELPPPTRRT